MTALAGLASEPLVRSRIKASLLALGITGTAFTVGIAFAASPVYFLAAGLAVLAVAACLVRTDAATYLVVAILYSNAAAVAVNYHGLPNVLGLAFPLALAIPLADKLLLQRRPITIASALPFLVGYLLVMLVSAAASSNPSSALDGLMSFLIGGFAVYLVLTNVVHSFSLLRNIVWVVLTVAAALGALSVFQTLTETYHNVYFGFAQTNVLGLTEDSFLDSTQGTPRLAGPIGEQNRYAQILLVLLPIGALFAVGERQRPVRWLAFTLTILILLGMAATFSRGAAVGLIAIMGAAFLFRYVKPVHIGIVLVAMALVFTMFPRYGERIENLQALTQLDRSTAGDSVQGDAANLRSRTTSTLAALFAFLDNPVVGVGPGQFPTHYHRYAQEVAAASIDTRIRSGARQAHNLYTGMAAEMGAFGFLFFMGIFAVTMRDLYRARRQWLEHRPEVAHLATGFLLAIIGYLASGIGLHLAFERYLWLLLALAGVTAHLALKGHLDSEGAPASKAGRGLSTEAGSVAVQPVAVAESPTVRGGSLGLLNEKPHSEGPTP